MSKRWERRLQRAKEEEQKAAYNKSLREAIAQSSKNAEKVSGNAIAEAQKAAMKGVPMPPPVPNVYKAIQRRQNYKYTEAVDYKYTEAVENIANIDTVRVYLQGDWNEPVGTPRPKAKPQPIDFYKNPKRKFNFDE